MSSLPPGALAAQSPGSKPHSQSPAANAAAEGQGAQISLPGSVSMPSGMAEFGMQGQASLPSNQSLPSSSTYRTLPPQPASQAAPRTSGTRRPLPTPPRQPPANPATANQTPRDGISSRRSLPTLPGGHVFPPSPDKVTPFAASTQPSSTTPHVPIPGDEAPPPPPPKPQVETSSSLSPDQAMRSQNPKDQYDSPASLYSTSTYVGDRSGSGPSRQTSISQSLARSSIRTPSTEESYRPWLDSDTVHEEDEQGDKPLYAESAIPGTNITIRPPSAPPPPDTMPIYDRRTPTPNSWAQRDDPLNHPNPEEPRQRTISSSTVGAVDAGLPPTPKIVPGRILEHQRSQQSLTASSPGHDISNPQTSSAGAVRGFALSRPSSTSSLSTRAQGDVEVLPAGGISTQMGHAHRFSDTSSLHPSVASSDIRNGLSPSWSRQRQQPSSWVQRKIQMHQDQDDLDFYNGEESGELGSAYGDEDEEYDDADGEGEEAEVNEIRFFQPKFLSESAVQLRDKVERGRHMKAGIAWVGAFTGRDIVSTLQSFLPDYTRESPTDRRYALSMARSLQTQLWFVEVDWDIKPIRDSPEDVFRFMGEMEGMSTGDGFNSELPTGLASMATKCYSPMCPQDSRCYAARCPYRQAPSSFLSHETRPPSPGPSAVPSTTRDEWTEEVDPRILNDLSDKQRERQTIIRQAIQSEIQFEADLQALETLYLLGLRDADPPVIQPFSKLSDFIVKVFSNELDLHDASRRLLEHFTIRERESAQRGLISSVGDIFLQAAADFRNIYPEYTGNLPQAENALRQEMEDNADFRFFCDRIVRENDGRRHIKYLITRPSDQLQHYYPAVLGAILNTTDNDDPDREFLTEALASIQNLSGISQLRLLHAGKGRGLMRKKEWPDVVPEETRSHINPKEQKRQMVIWELIKGEMEYVADLEVIDNLFVNGLRVAENGPIIDRPRLEIFLDEAFHNYRSLLEVHQRLLESLQQRQIEQHPQIYSIGDLMLDAALNWHDAYMEYVTHYPIARAKVQEEAMKNPRFEAFLEDCRKDPSVEKQDIYHFINRPVPRLLRYNLLLPEILKALKESDVSDDHPDIEAIPQVIDLIKDLGRATETGVAINESKVELWTYQHSLDGSKFGPRTVKDLDLLNPTRELIHRGKVYRQPEGRMSSWTELTVLLFDNYLVLVKPEKPRNSKRDDDRPVRYVINRPPIPLELLSLGNFGDGPRQQRRFPIGSSSHDTDSPGTGDSESNKYWPFSISFIGQDKLGGQYTLWTDTAASRTEWQQKLLHAKVLRAEVNDANKVFDMTPLSLDTFFMAQSYAPVKADGDGHLTGRVTCSTPFTTADGRRLVAVGCAEGVWIGLRNEPKSLRKVLHVKAVTNVAVLEEFGIFLVLQDRSLLAYHLEALVPSASSPQVRAAPQRLSPGKDVSFFTVGRFGGRTLVLFVKKKGIDSYFRVLEPISGRNIEDNARQRRPFGNLLGQRTEWFRVYKDFFIPTEAISVHWLKARLVVICAKGFEVFDMTDLKGATIPIFDSLKLKEKPALSELQRRCENARPLGMFRSTDKEFFLCYDLFGFYVDRHGAPSRDFQAIEWEGRPDSVAFHPPYVLLISAPFIEIRHIDSGKLLQIYTGSDIRLTWDGSGGQANPPNDNPGPNGYGDEATSQEPRIHICQKEDRKRGAFSQGIGQHVFELTPTLALNNPLLNPIHNHDANYFPPAPMMSHRESSVMTANSGEFYANMSMSTNNTSPPNRTPGMVNSASFSSTPGTGTPGTGTPGHLSHHPSWSRHSFDSTNSGITPDSNGSRTFLNQQPQQPPPFTQTFPEPHAATPPMTHGRQWSQSSDATGVGEPNGYSGEYGNGTPAANFAWGQQGYGPSGVHSSPPMGYSDQRQQASQPTFDPRYNNGPINMSNAPWGAQSQSLTQAPSQSLAQAYGPNGAQAASMGQRRDPGRVPYQPWDRQDPRQNYAPDPRQGQTQAQRTDQRR